VFALFALGNLAPPDIYSFLFPYVKSEVREVRWASALSLARLGDERVFQQLQSMLLEGIEEYTQLSEDDSTETHERYS
jgi:HEAT repeat protein